MINCKFFTKGRDQFETKKGAVDNALM